MDSKVLSFCIPTYGQPQKIRETLESLLLQDMDGVEILIRDDNDDSKTEKVISEYLAKLPITYFHMKKEGIDRAFLFLSKEAIGDFIWWFGDDVLEPMALSRVILFLRCNPSVDFMYINSTDLSGEHFSVQLEDSQYFADRDDVLVKLKDQLGFCSALLFKRETLALGFNKAEAFVGTCWVTFFLALHVLVSGRSFYFLNGRNFISESKPAGEVRWYDPFIVHGINFAVIVRHFDNHFSRDVLYKLQAYKFSRSWRAVIVERALRFKSGFAASDPKLTILFRLYWNYPEFYLALPLLMLPRPILIVFYGTYRKIRSFLG